MNHLPARDRVMGEQTTFGVERLWWTTNLYDPHYVAEWVAVSLMVPKPLSTKAGFCDNGKSSSVLIPPSALGGATHQGPLFTLR